MGYVCFSESLCMTDHLLKAFLFHTVFSNHTILALPPVHSKEILVVPISVLYPRVSSFLEHR